MFGFFVFKCYFIATIKYNFKWNFNSLMLRKIKQIDYTT